MYGFYVLTLPILYSKKNASIFNFEGAFLYQIMVLFWIFLRVKKLNFISCYQKKSEKIGKNRHFNVKPVF